MSEKPDLPWSEHIVSAWRNIDTGPGWWPIITRLDRDLRKISITYRVAQVKEKFGGLRYYTELDNSSCKDEFYARIREAEEEASRTCEECGQPGKLRDRRGWLKTLCDEEATEWEQR